MRANRKSPAQYLAGFEDQKFAAALVAAALLFAAALVLFAPALPMPAFVWPSVVAPMMAAVLSHIVGLALLVFGAWALLAGPVFAVAESHWALCCALLLTAAVALPLGWLMVGP
jgi:hypothetical protein